MELKDDIVAHVVRMASEAARLCMGWHSIRIARR